MHAREPAVASPRCDLRLPALRAEGQRQVRFKASVLCIDKRSGRTAYKGELNNPTGIFHVVGDGEKKTIDVVMQQKTVRLTFTDKPIPPPAAAGAKPAKPPAKSNPARALWDAHQEGPSFRATTTPSRRVKRHNESSASRQVPSPFGRGLG